MSMIGEELTGMGLNLVGLSADLAVGRRVIFAVVKHCFQVLQTGFFA